MHIVSRVGIGKIPPSSPLYLDVGGAVNFDNTLRVIGQTTVNSLISSQLSTNSLVYESRIEGEPNVLFSINRDGFLQWGLGGALTPDTNLYRSAVSTLRTSSSFIIDGSLSVGDSTADTAAFTARIASNFDPATTNLYSLGQDLLRWQNLWLSVKLTSVDGLFTGDLQVDGNTILGSADTDTLAINAKVSTSIIPASDNLNDLGSNSFRWKSLWLGSNLKVDGNVILGDLNSDTVAINGRVSTSIEPSADNLHNLGSLGQRWSSLWLGTDLQVDGNSILGSANTDTVAINAQISTSLVPSTDNTNNLGDLSKRWASLWLGADLQVDGDTILGDSPSDTVTINAGFASPLNPSVDNFYDLGTFDYRWKQVHVGPAGLVVRNDNTDTDKVSLFFSAGTATLGSSSAVNLKVTTGLNNGILLDTSGNVGINIASGPLSKVFNVNGTSDFSDTAYFSKPSGYSLEVQSIAGIAGSIESSNLEKQLNLGVGTETEFINLGTGSLTKTINIGTGSGKTTINIGGASDIININGTVTTTQTIQSFVSDKTFSLNVGGLNGTAQNSGLLVEEANSVLLDITDPTWQSGNTVRYFAIDTGNIEIGSVVLVTGFFNIQNNGQFVVTNVSANSYFEIENANITDSSFDEIASGQCTNPIVSAKILLSSDRSGWEFYSPANISNYFKLSNSGANAELKSTIDGLVVVSNALLPDVANTPIGSAAKQWDAHLYDLTVYNDCIIGNALTDTLNINSLTYFNNNIDSNVIPEIHENYNLGTPFNSWQSLYVKNIYSSFLSQLKGSIYLGTTASDVIYANGWFSTSLIAVDSTYDIGSLATPWNNVFANKLFLQNYTPGSITFINDAFEIAEANSKLFWDIANERLYLGQNTGSYILDIAKAGADSIRLRNTTDSQAIALNANSASTKLEFTSSLQFGANTYANVGNGGSTAVLELTSSQVKLLGAVSVNSVSVGTATYTVQSTDVIINVDTMSSGCAITLPSAVTKRLLVIKDIGNNASMTGRSIQLSPASNEYVEFNAINTAYVLDRDGESVTLQSDGVNRWYII
jgi:hypothetical protein